MPIALTVAVVTDHVVPMISVHAMPELMAKMLGLKLIALEEPAQRVSPGSVKLLVPTTLTQLLNALIKVFAIERLVNAHAFLTMMELLVKELFVQITVTMPVFALPKNN